MRYSALIEDFWQEWMGEPTPPEGTAWFYAQSHVDVFHPPVHQNLAKAIQLSGIPASIQGAYRMIDTAMVYEAHAGYVDESTELYRCDSYGYTESGDLVDEVFDVTIVEISTNE